MPNTIRTESELISLYADNITGDISAQEHRDLIVSLKTNETSTHIANNSNPHSTSIANLDSSTLSDLNSKISDANASEGWFFTVVSGTTQNIDANKKYLAYSTSKITFTLPSTLSNEDNFIIAGHGSGGWQINSGNTGQSICGGTVSTSAGQKLMESSTDTDNAWLIYNGSCLSPLFNEATII